jgi:hypothetical protein
MFFERANSCRGRTSLFGSGRPVPMDREAKVRVQHLARCLSRQRAKGHAYGAGIGGFFYAKVRKATRTLGAFRPDSIPPLASRCVPKTHSPRYIGTQVSGRS